MYARAAGTNGKGLVFTKDMSFVQAVEKACVQTIETDDEKRLNQIVRSFNLSDLLDYVRWKNEGASKIAGRQVLATMLPRASLSNGESDYSYIERHGSDESEEGGSKQVKLPEQRVSRAIKNNSDTGRLDFLDDFLVWSVVDDLENQIINGAGEVPGGQNIEGLLKQGCKATIQEGNLFQVCLRAIDQFCEQSDRSPSAIVMTSRQKLCLMRALFAGNSDSQRVAYAAPFSCFAGIPIVISNFMPDGQMVLANFDDVCLVSNNRKNVGDIKINKKITLVYKYWCNIVLKDTKSVMIIDMNKE